MWPFPQSQESWEAEKRSSAYIAREARHKELNRNLEALGKDIRFGGGRPLYEFFDAVEEIALMVTRSELERRKV